jgi:hypothetical protein
MSIHEKLFKIKGELTGVEKDAENPFLKNEYVSLNKLLDTVNPIFQRDKILMYQSSEYAGDNFCQTTTTLTDIEDNSSISSSVSFQAGSKAQESAGALTYMRRYGLITLLGLKAEDDDGNEASGKTKTDMVKDTFKGEVVATESNKTKIVEKMKDFPKELQAYLKENKLTFAEIVEFAEAHKWDTNSMMLEVGIV